jgi:multisubunit Na+/H+ antiporter MnhC subunit
MPKWLWIVEHLVAPVAAALILGIVVDLAVLWLVG